MLEEEAPYHPLGFPTGWMPRLVRMATMRRVVEGLTEAELDRVCGRKPADSCPDQEYVVRRCLKVMLKEEADHHRYAVRDLVELEAGA